MESKSAKYFKNVFLDLRSENRTIDFNFNQYDLKLILVCVLLRCTMIIHSCKHNVNTFLSTFHRKFRLYLACFENF